MPRMVRIIPPKKSAGFFNAAFPFLISSLFVTGDYIENWMGANYTRARELYSKRNSKPSPSERRACELIISHLCGLGLRLNNEGTNDARDQYKDADDQCNQAACGMVVFDEIPINASRDTSEADDSDHVRNNFHSKLTSSKF